MNADSSNYSLVRDERSATALEDQGFVVMPLLSDIEVGQLLKLFEQNKPVIDRQYYASIDSQDDEYKKKVDQGIRDVIHEPLQRLLKPFDLMTGSFIVKKPGKESIVYIHTDWTFSDEADGSPIVAWIPLHDVNKKNGAIEVIEGSHQFVPKVRGPGIPNTLLPYHKYIRKKWAKLVPMTAGEVLFFKSGLIHCSPSNLSNDVRVAIRIEILAADRKMIIYYQDEDSDNEVGVYEIGKDFFTTYVKGEEPKAPLLETIHHQPPEFSKAKLKSYLGKGRFVWV